ANGCIGTVRHIIFKPNDHPQNLTRRNGQNAAYVDYRPFVILIEFDSYTGPPLFGPNHSPRLVPILPYTYEWKDERFTLIRNQFPIQLAYGMTIHKSQGLQFNSAVIDFGYAEKFSGQAYVALSR